MSSLYKGNTLELFHLSGKYPHLIHRFIIWVTEGTISGQASFKSLADADASVLCLRYSLSSGLHCTIQARSLDESKGTH